MGQCLEVSREDPGVTRMTGAGARPPGEGEVLFTVERFGLSANNITYAALGDTLRYWDLFPAEPGWGRIPAWGYLRVRSSRVAYSVYSWADAATPGTDDVALVLRPGRRPRGRRSRRFREVTGPCASSCSSARAGPSGGRPPSRPWTAP